MKISEFLSEEKIDFTSLADLEIDNKEENYRKIWKSEIRPILEHNCKEIIGIYKKSGCLLYRGVKSSKTVMVSGIRTDRKPVELNHELQRIADEVIVELGGTAKRGNSIFSAVSSTAAGMWGRYKYIIFPKDGFSTTFFTKSSGYMFDEIDHIDPSKKTAKQELTDIFKSNGINFNKQELAKYMKEADDDNLVGEVLIAGDSYIGLHARVFEDLVLDMVKKFKG